MVVPTPIHRSPPATSYRRMAEESVTKQQQICPLLAGSIYYIIQTCVLDQTSDYLFSNYYDHRGNNLLVDMVS